MLDRYISENRFQNSLRRGRSNSICSDLNEYNTDTSVDYGRQDKETFLFFDADAEAQARSDGHDEREDDGFALELDKLQTEEVADK